MAGDSKRRTEKDRRRIQRKLDQEVPKLDFQFDPGALFLTGPIITTNIGITQSHADAITAAGAAVPTSVRCRFLVDTGADVCVVKHEIAAAAGLKLISTNVPLRGVGIDTSGCVYMGRIWFGVESKKVPGVLHRIFVDTRVMSGTLGAQPLFDGIIGRDVLQHFEMLYNGKTGRVTLRYFRPAR